MKHRALSPACLAALAATGARRRDPGSARSAAPCLVRGSLLLHERPPCDRYRFPPALCNKGARQLRTDFVGDAQADLPRS